MVDIKLQLALDNVGMQEAELILEQVHEHVDIIEIGTPFALKEGTHAVKRIKESFPHKLVLADFKIMDGGKLEAAMAYEAGADIVTVLAAAYDATINAVVREAKTRGKAVMADMIGVQNIVQRATELERMGVDFICVHTAFDIQAEGFQPLEQLQTLAAILDPLKLAAAGGIKRDTVDRIVQTGVHIVVVGQSITAAKDRKDAAREIKSRLRNGEGNFV